MTAAEQLPRMRVTFVDFLPDPEDEDVLRRAVTVVADRLTFEDDCAVLWAAGLTGSRADGRSLREAAQ